MSTAREWLTGGGELGELIRARDWSTTSLGPRESWPQSLRSLVGMMLASRAQIILFWGSEHVCLYNDAYKPVFALKHPWALGRPGREAWMEIWAHQLEPLLEGVVASGEAFWGSDLPFALERLGYPEDTYFDVSYDPVRDETGLVVGIYCIVSETTGRVVGERRLRVLRDLGEAFAESRTEEEVYASGGRVLAAAGKDISFALAYELEAQGGKARRVCAVNAPQGASWAPETLDGDAIWPMHHIHEGGRVLWEGDLAALGRLPGGEWAEPTKRVIVLPLEPSGTGKRIALVLGLSPRLPYDDRYRDFVRLLGDGFASAIGSAHALEAERHRAEVLAQLDAAKTAFFSNVSHEFRTPLTLLLAPLEEALAAPDAELPGDLRAGLETAHRNALRLSKLVNALLDFSRIEAGRSSASFEPVDLARATADLASNFRSACEKAGLQLVVRCERLPEPVWVDRDMWEKVVLNLVSNAFKFTFEGMIEVSVHHTPAGPVVEVRDTGEGIAAAELPRIFERFRRVSGVRSRTYEGSGIGLALVHDLVAQHGGGIQVESKEGKGTRFSVALKYGSDHLPKSQLGAGHADEATSAGGRAYIEEALGWLRGVQPAEQVEATAGASGPLDAARILVADDNADMRDHIARLLQGRWHVECVADGEAALERLRGSRFDLVLTDVMMPRLDGFGLLRAIRTDPALAETAVIMLSARAGEESRIEGLDAGADDYLVKPFSGRELLALVRSQIAIRRLRQATAKEREVLLRRAEEANHAKDAFLAMLGHELRNPLSPIVAALRLMRMRGIDALELEILERQAGHLTRLVDDLLDVSRIARGRLDLRRRRIELSDVIRRAMDMAAPLIESRGHRVELQLAHGPLTIMGDPDRLAQVVSNLLNNAAKYSDQGTRIGITCERAGDRIRLRIDDEGMGIAPEAQAGIFDLFVQQQQTIDRAQGGLGLGLAIVKNIVELHGGRVRVESAGIGKGSCFTVDLPTATSEGVAEDQPEAPHPTKAATALRVLIVDDNADGVTMLASSLRLVGHEVEVAHNGDAALEVAGRFYPEVALIDIGLPLMDGYELARRLRNLPDPPQRLFAITGYGAESDRQRAMGAGFDRHFVKPVDLDELSDALDFGEAPSAAAASGVVAA